MTQNVLEEMAEYQRKLWQGEVVFCDWSDRPARTADGFCEWCGSTEHVALSAEPS